MMPPWSHLIAQIPAGAWAVGVSGGADSVALLELLRGRGELSLHVVHLDHETRAGASAADAQFVASLARRWGLPCTIEHRSQVEASLAKLPANLSARYRAARFALFRRVIDLYALDGVLLAHHLDDQAETVLQRLLRGSGPAGLGGMKIENVVSGVRVLRPLLHVRRAALRALLTERGVAWREDASNAAMNQQRNRVRHVLMNQPALDAPLLELAEACLGWNRWLTEAAPRLEETFTTRELAWLPSAVARESARRWLQERSGAGGATAGDVTAGMTAAGVVVDATAADRLVEMAADAASPGALQFAGGLFVRRRGGRISAGFA
jgi:tRNA(Ile)-lysidine synthase